MWQGDHFLKCLDQVKNWVLTGEGNVECNLLKTHNIVIPHQSHRAALMKNNGALFSLIDFYGGNFPMLITLCDHFDTEFSTRCFICDWKNKKEVVL